MFSNYPDVKLGIVAVSRDCFPASLSERRRTAVVDICSKNKLDIFECNIIVENEIDAMNALASVKNAGVNALLIYLGNFGPEGPETMLAKNLTARLCLQPLPKKLKMT